MPNIYKVRPEDSEGNVLLYHSAADVVSFDAGNIPGIVAGNVQDAIAAVNQKAEGKASVTTLTTIIEASAFIERYAPFTQVISVPGVLESDEPDIGILMSNVPADALAQRDAFGSVSAIRTGNGTITVYCYEDKPAVDTPIFIRIFR